MAQKNYYTEMKENVSPNNAALGLSNKKIISTNNIMENKLDFINNMNKDDLSKLSKSQLIQLLLKQNLEVTKLLQKNVQQQPKNNNNQKPIPAPRNSV